MTTSPGCSTADWTLGEPKGWRCHLRVCQQPLHHAPDLGIDRIGNYWANAATRTFAELLIDCEEDRALRVVLVGMLRERRPGFSG